jgi:hypothetical protein
MRRSQLRLARTTVCGSRPKASKPFRGTLEFRAFPGRRTWGWQRMDAQEVFEHKSTELGDEQAPFVSNDVKGKTKAGPAVRNPATKCGFRHDRNKARRRGDVEVALSANHDGSCFGTPARSGWKFGPHGHLGRLTAPFAEVKKKKIHQKDQDVMKDRMKLIGRRDTRAHSRPITRSENGFVLYNPPESPITAVEYGTLQGGYDFLNAECFENSLPQVLITLRRHGRARGYFSPKRFQRRGKSQDNVHEVALNPDSFAGRTDEEILSTGDAQRDTSSNDYDRVIDLMTDAVQKVSKRGITKADFLPALVDFTAAVGLAIRGEGAYGR